uniref:GtrA family protein n=1 Tax=Prevotella sp. GTC17262 TaxID=3236797 RepID=A0AB33JJJ9_9BACT
MNKQFGEIIRFGIVGGVATLLQYGIYLLLIKQMGHNPAMTAGYVLSFVFNYLASTYFTFRVKASAKRGAGFALSHVVNYLLQMATLNFFLWVGIPKTLAPIPMFCVCVPVNFLLVRYFLKRK